MLDQLPNDTQCSIFKDFLYQDFLFKFKRLFVFSRREDEGKIKKVNGVNVKIQHTRYTWEHEPYRRFIYNLCRNLEPRIEFMNTILVDENTETYEVLFFEQGTFYIGYTLNNQHYWGIKQTLQNILFAYECTYNLRSSWIY